jgi:hypothetical protein
METKMKAKKSIAVIGVMVLATFLTMCTAVALALDLPAMPRMFSNSRFVYVTAYDGNQFDPNLLPDDRAAISRVQDAIQKWGKLVVVYRPQEADVILAVQSRPSEDVLAVYDAHSGFGDGRPSQAYLWRVMAAGGLQKGEVPLVSQFEQAWDKIAK